MQVTIMLISDYTYLHCNKHLQAMFLFYHYKDSCQVLQEEGSIKITGVCLEFIVLSLCKNAEMHINWKYAIKIIRFSSLCF